MSVFVLETPQSFSCVDSYLGEANVGALLTEALTADVQAVLADQTSLVGADTAIHHVSPSILSRTGPFTSSLIYIPYLQTYQLLEPLP